MSHAVGSTPYIPPVNSGSITAQEIEDSIAGKPGAIPLTTLIAELGPNYVFTPNDNTLTHSGFSFPNGQGTLLDYAVFSNNYSSATTLVNLGANAQERINKPNYGSYALLTHVISIIYSSGPEYTAPIDLAKAMINHGGMIDSGTGSISMVDTDSPLEEACSVLAYTGDDSILQAIMTKYPNQEINFNSPILSAYAPHTAMWTLQQHFGGAVAEEIAAYMKN